MNADLTSNVEFKSNIQAVTAQSLNDDRTFLESVRDPFALTILSDYGIRLTSIQKREYDSASRHCSYAYKDDYPWGTVIDEDGRERVTCKCTRQSCVLFRKCRPNFDPEELNVSESNIRFLGTEKEFLSSSSEPQIQRSETDNAFAAVFYSAKNPDNRNSDGIDVIAVADFLSCP